MAWAKRMASSTNAVGNWAATIMSCGIRILSPTIPSTDPIYVSVPFYLVVRHGQAHGIFLDNTWRSTFDVGPRTAGSADVWRGRRRSGLLLYQRADPKQVIERYTALTGRMPLPPLWSLGFNQCRYSYYPESKVRWIADTFRAKTNSRRCHLAGHSLSGQLQAIHLGFRALSGSEEDDCRFARGGFPPRLHRGCASEGGKRLCTLRRWHRGKLLCEKSRRHGV